MRRRAAFGLSEDGADEGGDGGMDTPSKGAIRVLRKLDLFPKVAQEEKEQTTTGGAVFTIAAILMAGLLLSELYQYLVVTPEHHVRVDPTVGEKLRIEFDITFHALHCGEVNLDAMDVTGEQQEPDDHGIWKERIGANGKIVGDRFKHLLPWERQQHDEREELLQVPDGFCGSCYGAETPTRRCCNTCEEVKAAYIDKGWNAAGVSSSAKQCENSPTHADKGEEGEGCRVGGYMLVNKVAGNLNVAMGEIHVRDTRHIHQFNPANIPRYNVTHTIHRLRFGPDGPFALASKLHPLEGITQAPREGAGVYQYYLKIVPTVFSLSGNDTLRTNQYSMTTFYRPAVVGGIRQNVLPGVFVVYDLSPFMVLVTHQRQSFVTFLTGLCAIIGGVFVTSRLIDEAIYAFRGAMQRASGVRAVLAAATSDGL